MELDDDITVALRMDEGLGRSKTRGFSRAGWTTNGSDLVHPNPTPHGERELVFAGDGIISPLRLS